MNGHVLAIINVMHCELKDAAIVVLEQAPAAHNEELAKLKADMREDTRMATKDINELEEERDDLERVVSGQAKLLHRYMEK